MTKQAKAVVLKPRTVFNCLVFYSDRVMFDSMGLYLFHLN